MGDHKRRDPIPWFYWVMRFNFRQHYIDVYRAKYQRGRRGATLRTLLTVAVLGGR